MTHVERSTSTARLSKGARLVLKGIALGLVGVTVIATAIFSFARTGFC